MTKRVTGRLATIYSPAADCNNYQYFEGKYSRTEARRATPTSIECPYCHEPLGLMNAGRISRIIRVKRVINKDKAVAMVKAVPKTHRVLGCVPCRQAFTVPVRQFPQVTP